MDIPKQAYIDDLSVNQIIEIERRCKPGFTSNFGFLSAEQDLRSVIEADSKTLQRLGITHEQIADKLESLILQAKREDDIFDRTANHYSDHNKAFERGYNVNSNRFVVACFYSMGSQECPFFIQKNEREILTCGRGSTDYKVTNTGTGESIYFPGLMIHLVRDHHFFEGDATYRLDPNQAVKVLDLRSGVDYTPKFSEEVVWQYHGSWSTYSIGKSAEATYKLAEETMQGIQPIRIEAVEFYLNRKTGFAVIKSQESKKLAMPVYLDGEFVSTTRISSGLSVLKHEKIKYCIG